MTRVPAFPKPRRLRDPDYLAWIRSRPCIVSGARAEAHHTVPRSIGGSDYRAVPLAPRLHRELHRLGSGRFGQKYRVDLREEAMRHMEMYLAEIRERAA